MQTTTANELFSKISWNRFFKLKQMLKDQMNEPTQRFLKSAILDGALEEYSDGYFKYVDKTGHDLISECGTRVEVKNLGSQIKAPDSKSKLDIRIYSKYGSNNNSCYSDTEIAACLNRFDYLLLIGDSSCGYLSNAELKNSLIEKSDAIIARIFHKDVNWLVKDHRVKIHTQRIDLEQVISKTILDILQSV